ncbi:hypothetical protein M33023_06190 [Candidatus Phytoplasma asteris]|uniref:Uncharacterized protein n=2 Tax=16SrI (Aster yellows group) TaxID=3042590 RepID=Q2NIM4_AYWBP|nr:hypothetical protein [Aster yellows witches'-broom phytoplasma]ABC65719.1 conserved hypothetical protein [Aster yellows witches'-broom phytoplasma AYWB]
MYSSITQKTKKTLHKYILAAHILALALILFHISKQMGFYDYFRSPLTYKAYLNFALVPLFYLGFFFGFKKAYLTLIIYLFCEFVTTLGHFWILADYDIFLLEKININKVTFFILNYLLKNLMPLLSWSFTGLLYYKDLSHFNINKKNIIRLLIILIIIMLIHTCLYTINGYLCYLPSIKYILKDNSHYNIFFANGITSFITIFVLNLETVITCNLLLLVCVIYLNPRLKIIYQTYFYDNK